MKFESLDQTCLCVCPCVPGGSGSFFTRWLSKSPNLNRGSLGCGLKPPLLVEPNFVALVWIVVRGAFTSVNLSRIKCKSPTDQTRQVWSASHVTDARLDRPSCLGAACQVSGWWSLGGCDNDAVPWTQRYLSVHAAFQRLVWKQSVLCASSLGRPIVFLLPAGADPHVGRGTTGSLCDGRWNGAQCVLKPAADASANVTCRFTF